MKNILSGLDPVSLQLVRDIGALARARGMKAYLVGGPVRDLILGHPSLDLDITVEGRGIILAQAFAASHKGRAMTYPAFGTATVTLAGRRKVDFATARKETYARPGAFPAVEFSNIKDDLSRRDFTVNAMAVSIDPRSWGRTVDPFGGRKDLKAKKIRVLHERSFIDDPTRILRAARFSARLGFALERKTLDLLKAALRFEALDCIKPQRYMKEYNRILKEDRPQPALECLKAWRALKEEVHAAH